MSESEAKHRPDVDQLIQGNPKVDAEQFREAQELLDELRKEGIRPPGYDIASPYQRRPLTQRVKRRGQR